MTGALLAAGTALAISAAAAAASGSETFKGTIVTSGVSGTRTVIHSVVVANGAFSGVGRIVEIPNLPTDPDNVSRDDLVFAGGSIHIVSTIADFSVSVTPHNCHASATIQQTGEIAGGTRQFAAATGSFTGTVTGPALLARNPDGSCSFTQPALHEVDMIAASGHCRHDASPVPPCTRAARGCSRSRVLAACPTGVLRSTARRPREPRQLAEALVRLEEVVDKQSLE